MIEMPLLILALLLVACIVWIHHLRSRLSTAARERGEQLQVLKQQAQKISAEVALLQERYRTLTDNLAAAVVIRDRSDKIVYCSPYTEVLTGYPISEIYNSAEDFFLRIAHEEDRESYRRAQKVISVGEAFQFRFRFYHRTGIEMWGETRTVPILGPNGQVISSLSIILDVTGTILYQRQVEERNRDLHDFTYMISHDLKAPIFTIKGMMGILEAEGGDKLSSDAREALTHINKATGRLESLVSSVLEYAKVSAQDSSKEVVELRNVLEEISGDFAPQLRTLGATLSIAPEFPAVYGDKLKLYQIFSNLVGNAMKYRSADRPLTIEIAHEQPRNTRKLSVTIRDNGLGIPSDKLDSIFRPFHRAHGGSIEGSGIGLACVKRLLEKIGGEVGVTSEVNKGSIFTLTLRRHTMGTT